jgi:hypothetical protein
MATFKYDEMMFNQLLHNTYFHHSSSVHTGLTGVATSLCTFKIHHFNCSHMQANAQAFPAGGGISTTSQNGNNVSSISEALRAQGSKAKPSIPGAKIWSI